MTRQVVRNIYGQALTKNGAVDKRQYNNPSRENDGKPYQFFEVVHMPRDKTLPWQVFGFDALTGERTVISKHAKEKTALREAEKHRINQPGRQPSKKLKYKLRIRE